jgi:V/A-type H+-transporting ATPase subunit A
LIKEALLQQSATDEVDSYAAPEKQYLLLAGLLAIYDQGMALVRLGVPARRLLELPVMSEARRWKTRFGAGDMAGLRERIAAIPVEFGELGSEYTAVPSPLGWSPQGRGASTPLPPGGEGAGGEGGGHQP